MKLHLPIRAGRADRNDPAVEGSPPARRRSGLFARSAALAAALAVVATSFAFVAPTSASADSGAVEIVNGYNWGGALRVDVEWASTNPYQGAFLWPNNASASQEFNLLSSGNGYYRIQARHSGQCLMLDWRGGTYTNGTRIIQYPACYAGYTPAEWSTQWVWKSHGCTGNCFITGSWYALIKNHRTGKCLDAANGAGGQPRAQAVLQQWDCIGSVNQWNVWNQLWSFGTATSQEGPGPR